MAGVAIPVASIVVGLVSKFLPSIIQLVHGVHPVPPNADPAVKADINAMKAEAANKLASVLLNQFATSGALPASASDPSVQSMLAGAVEQAFQSMKASGALVSSIAGAPAPSIPVQTLNLPFIGKWEITAVRL